MTVTETEAAAPKTTYELISDCIDQAKAGLQELSARVSEFDSANAATEARETASAYLATAITKANTSLAELTATAQSLKDSAAEVPTKAFTVTISSVNAAVTGVKEVAYKYDEEYKLSSQVSAAIEGPRDRVNEAVASLATYVAQASAAANAKLQGLTDGLMVTLSSAALSGLDKALPIALQADKKYHVTEKVVLASTTAATVAKDLDQKYKVTETAKTYAEKYDVEARAQQMLTQAQGLDQKVTGGRVESAIVAAYNAGLSLAGFVAEKYVATAEGKQTEEAAKEASEE